MLNLNAKQTHKLHMHVCMIIYYLYYVLSLPILKDDHQVSSYYIIFVILKILRSIFIKRK